MNRTISACVGLALGMMAVGAFAATKHPARKGAAGLQRADIPRGGFGRERWRAAGRLSTDRAMARSRCMPTSRAAKRPTISCSPTASGSPPRRPHCLIGRRIAPSQRNCQSRPLPELRLAPASGSRSSSPMPATSAWGCSTGLTARPGIFAAPAPIDAVSDWRACHRISPRSGLARTKLSCNVQVMK